MDKLYVSSLTCEYRQNSLGIDIRKPRISWQIQSNRRGTMQQAYQYQVSLTKDHFDQPLWDTGYMKSEQSLHIPYEGPELTSRTRYYYRVKVWDNFCNESDWSSVSWWETAFLDAGEWKAEWITPNPQELAPESEPAFLLRKEFELKAGIESARIYATGVGLYELHLNGERVGDELLAPGWTSYHNRLQYQTYEVTAQLQSSSNAIGVILANGWYKGNLAWEGKRNFYGDKRGILLQLNVRYFDGSEEIIVSDPTWMASTGPILFSEIYHGETYDARLEQKGWSEPGFNETTWKGVIVRSRPLTNLVAQENNPVRVTETLPPNCAFIAPNGDSVIDMGQNMVGRLRFKVQSPAGTKIVLKHAEVLDRNGNIYFGNLRSARQTIEYITKGEGVEEYAPAFTFQGFRYVKVEGYPLQDGMLPVANFVGEVIHTDMEQTGMFETSNPQVNQLQQNIDWGQRGNFVDVPTDCPQRDERLGWTGDAQVFIRTALFNYQGGPFFTKWLRDLKADQFEDGGVPFVIPDVLQDSESSSTAWGDAAVICPWTVYLVNGDKRFLAEQYESMKKWVKFIRLQGDNEYLWNTGFQLGDWLGLDAKENSYIGATARDFIATAFYAYSARLVRDAAVVLGKSEDVRHYSELLSGIIHHFNQEFITPTGRLTSQTQTAYVLALAFDLIDGKVRERAAFELNELVLENDYHLTTGFVGTPYLCFALSNNGYHETAVKLLLQDTYPSWLYSISKGATTIWEHWDSIKPDGSFWSDDMNSFNHYAYGAIGDWMYRVVAGLDMDESEPAYKRIRIQPRLGGAELTHVKATYNSMYGKIVSAWKITEDEVRIEVEIPVNTTAEIILPNAVLTDVLEGGLPLTVSEGILFQINAGDGVRLKAGSGVYRFIYPNSKGLSKVYTNETRLIELLNDESAKRILEKYAPGITKPNPTANLKMKTLNQLAAPGKAKIPQEKLVDLNRELNQTASTQFSFG
ncbi:family 78 glycoside hydrolase catalytic domain [Bacillus sp. EB106-08-02-XG196]|jgi:alpha-L-rhamnosidase|uniref:alpha-L-rhamnosidase n=1 Tax=Bacillus sp. EB106-08-02-XG196 TaxID=2737049 RepID=UPI0015C48FF9|nr:alpha-L-rhamnosidase [Bacillus sp. EB106-08-02-XG196]NWQ41702.1 family 78 glycoside hydrolase catalytic domain [Bacillus sp. EB106-08-02-XG196]